MKILFDQATVRGETIRLAPDERIHFLMHSTFERCRIELATAGKNYQVTGNRFLDCEIVAEVKTVGVWFAENDIERCTFRGTFRNCEFGNRAGRRAGSIVESSFAEAVLDDCTFYGDPVESLRWPGWPHLVILEPLQHLKEWSATPWPPGAGMELDHLEGWEPAAGMRAVVWHLPSKDVDPEEIWALVQDKPYVVFPGKDGKARMPAERVAEIAARHRAARSQVEDEHRVLEPWAYLDRARLAGMVRSGAECRLVFHLDTLRKKVADAPPEVHAVIRCGAAEAEALQKRVEELAAAKFIVRGFDVERGTVVLRGHRKTLGTLVIPATEVAYELPDRTPLASETFGKWVERYWA